MAILATSTLLAVLAALYVFALRRQRDLSRLVAELRGGERKFRDFSERSPDALFVARADGSVRFWNTAAARMFGYSSSEMIGRGIDIVLGARGDWGKGIDGFNAFMAAGRLPEPGLVLELGARRKDGTEFPVEISLAALPSGETWDALGIARDLTEPAAREEERRLANEDVALRLRQQSLLAGFLARSGLDRESTGAALQWLADALPGAWRRPEIACARVTLGGRSFRTANFQELRPGQRADVVVDGEVRGMVEAGYLHEDLRSDSDPFRKREQEFLDEIVRDLGSFDRRIEAGEALRIANRIVESSSILLYRVRFEPGMPMTYISANVSKFGYRPEQFAASPVFYQTLTHPADRAMVREARSRLLAGGGPESFSFRLRAGDGSWRWMEGRLAAVPTANGVPSEAEGVLIDVTERKLASVKLGGLNRVLDAITKIALDLLSTTAIDTAMPGLLKVVGEAVEADRVFVLENRTAPGGIVSIRVRFAWNSPAGKAAIQPVDLAERPDLDSLMGSFLRGLPRGEVFTAFPRTMPGQPGAFLRSLNVQSVLLVPVPNADRTWGYLGIEDRHAERQWEPAQCDALKILAEIVGVSIERARNLAELADTKRIVENSPTVLFRMEGSIPMPVTYISANVSRWGYEPSQFTDSPSFYYSLIHPDDLTRVGEWRARLASDGTATSSLEFRIRVAGGGYRWFDDRISLVRDSSGGLLSVEGLLLDITERKEVEDNLTFSNNLLRGVIENSPDGVLVVDMAGKILWMNERFLEMWKVPQLAGAVDDSVVLEAATPMLKDPAAFAEKVRDIYEHPDRSVHDEIEFRDGRVFDRHANVLRGADGGYVARIWFFRDIAERKRAEVELAKLARTDPLTGLANRSTFLERLNLAFVSARRASVPFSVLYLDLDRFKEINDTLGHQAGDGLLQEAARRMAVRIRETDAVARFGGDEFAVLQIGGDASVAATLAKEIRAVLAEPYDIDGSRAGITASVGIASSTSEAANPAEILEQADQALYLAKREGKDRFRFYSLELDRAVHDRMNLSDDFHDAIAHGELELYYRPRIALATGAIAGVEARMRWNHPTRGQLETDLILPAAERAGMLVPLGQWTLNQACLQYRRWRDQGIAPPEIALCLSGVQLKARRDFDSDVAAALEKSGLSPRNLEFEFSEATLAATSVSNPGLLERLRDLGVGLALDGSGAADTAVGRLRAFGVRRFKISPQFMNVMASSPSRSGNVRSMLASAGRLGFELIAASVETEEEASSLASLSQSEVASGCFRGGPLSSSAFTAWLLQTREAKPCPAGAIR